MTVVAQDRVFTVRSGMSEAFNVVTMRLPPAQVTIAFDLDQKLDPRGTISSATITEVNPDEDNPLTIGTVAINQEQVSAPVSDWTAETRYRLKCEVTMADSSIIAAEGKCEVTSF